MELQELWKKVEEILDRGNSVEIHKSRDGLKIYEVRKKLMVGKPTTKNS